MNTQNKTSVNKSGRVWEWLVEDSSGAFIAGGYCATKADAESDLAHWVNGGSIRSAPSIVKKIGHAL